MNYSSLRRALLLVGIVLVIGCAPPNSSDEDDKDKPTPRGYIGGTINIPERVILDSDARDPANPPVPNNTPTTAQVIDNLVIVAGNADFDADQNDYFSVNLAVGETVILFPAGPGDLDLYLYKSGVQVASSTFSGTASEEVIATATGDYQILVTADSGASSYRLQVGTWLFQSAVVAGGAPPLSAAAEFVPGEVLVQMKDQPPTAARAARPHRVRGQELERRHGLRMLGMGPRGRGRFSIADSNPADPNAADTARRRTLEKVRELSADPEVQVAQPNFIYRAAQTPNDPGFAKQWGATLMNLPEAWDLTTGSAEVVVAVIDTGVLYNHPDLTANILRDSGTVVGYDFISDPLSANDGNGRDPDPLDAGDESDQDQSSFHGTHVAGIIAAAGNNSTGVAGVAWTARIMPLRVLGKDDGSTYDVVEAIEYAAGLPNDSGTVPRVAGVTRPADIINLSLGGGSNDGLLQTAINNARAAGVVIVAAGGNEQNSAPFYPASCNGVIGVSAVDKNGNRAPYSNYGSYIDLAAPGGNVYQTDGGIYSTLASGLNPPALSYNYAWYQGTSMACPHVSGVIALMKAYHKLYAPPGDQLTPEEIDGLIRGTTPGIDSITNQPPRVFTANFGFGLIDAFKAVQAAGILAGNSAAALADLYLQPDQVDFGFGGTVGEVYLGNRGTKTLTNLSVVPHAYPWILDTISGNTLTVRVDRASLADGPYQATLTIHSDNGGDESLIITAIKGVEVTSELGVIYVIAVDPNGRVVAGTTTSAAAGWAYRLRLAPGRYQIFAGTDLDNDGNLGDEGEYFGGYPSASAPTTNILYSGGNLANRSIVLQPVTSSSASLSRSP